MKQPKINLFFKHYDVTCLTFEAGEVLGIHYKRKPNHLGLLVKGDVDKPTNVGAIVVVPDPGALLMIECSLCGIGDELYKCSSCHETVCNECCAYINGTIAMCMKCDVWKVFK